MFQHRKRMMITASVADAYDGLIRIAVDAQRFGFTLSEVNSEQEGAYMTLSMTIQTAADAEEEQIATRLARHPTVLRVQVVELQPNDLQGAPPPAFTGLPACGQVARA